MDKVLQTSTIFLREIRYRLFRDSCVPVEGTFIKDLSVLGRDLNRVVIVDNALEAFSFQVCMLCSMMNFCRYRLKMEFP